MWPNIEPVWHVIVPWIAASSALVAAGAALVETDLKRIIAFSTVSQIGFIFLGLAIAGFGFLLTLYSSVFMSDKPALKQFYAYFLLTLAFANGIVLADNLILLLFFWEALLLTLFGLIIIGKKDAYKTAIKAFIIIGITDLCMFRGLI